MSEFNWVCPHCNHSQTVVRQKWDMQYGEISVGTTSYSTPIGYSVFAIGCSNSTCKKIVLEFSFGAVDARAEYNQVASISPIKKTKIIPESNSKPQPVYIPSQILNDYEEACRIADLSPKAAATLARRCIQGVIRDFCGFSKGTLDAEIKTLQKAFKEGTAPHGVSEESLTAIEAIRQIGNIGAHMERDINIIVDIEPNEARLLIELVETLFEDWYVERHKRTERFSKIDALAAEKTAARKAKSEIDNLAMKE